MSDARGKSGWWGFKPVGAMSPVAAGDRIELPYEMTGVPDPAWAVVDFVLPTARGELPGFLAEQFRWKICFRLTLLLAGADIVEQFGMVYLDDQGCSHTNTFCVYLRNSEVEAP